MRKILFGLCTIGLIGFSACRDNQGISVEQDDEVLGVNVVTSEVVTPWDNSPDYGWITCSESARAPCSKECSDLCGCENCGWWCCKTKCKQSCEVGASICRNSDDRFVITGGTACQCYDSPNFTGDDWVVGLSCRCAGPGGICEI